MGRAVATKRNVKPAKPGYILDEQIGFILRQVWQRHAMIFAHCVGVRLMPMSRAKIMAWRCQTWRRMKPICSSST